MNLAATELAVLCPFDANWIKDVSSWVGAPLEVGTVHTYGIMSLLTEALTHKHCSKPLLDELGVLVRGRVDCQFSVEHRREPGEGDDRHLKYSRHETTDETDLSVNHPLDVIRNMVFPMFSIK
eukprot:1706797-Rhodomonas_salina.9